MRAVVGVALVFTLTGCSALDGIRRPPPAPPASSSRATFEVRTARVPVPADYQQSAVEFAGARHGAAMYTRCAVPKRRVGNHNDCSAILLVTDDGGRSWQRRVHPEPVADSQQLYVGFGGTLVLLAEPHAYYTSLDWGRTFKQSPYSEVPPIAYRLLGGPYEICCDADPVPTIRRIDGGDQPDPVVVTRPPIPGSPGAVVYRPGRDLWVASVAGGRAYTAVSGDEGRTWTARTVPGSDGGLGFVRLQTPNDQSDLWLIGDRDRTSFPAVWRLGTTGWQRLRADGAPAEYRSTAPVGGGALAVAGPLGTGQVTSDGSYRPTGWPAGDWLQELGDGTLFITDNLRGLLWLGPGGAAHRRWIQLVLKNS
jgi:hypothetical protein